MLDEPKIKLLIGTDKYIRKDLLQSLNPFFRKIDVANDGLELYEKYYLYNPEIMLIDIHLKYLSSFEVIYRIKQVNPTVIMLLLSDFTRDEFIYQAIEAGANGLVNKNIKPEELIFALKTIYAGGSYFLKDLNDKDVLELITEYEERFSSIYNSSLKMTEREEKILRLITKGSSSEKKRIFRLQNYLL